jgi:hypothetical protein
MVSHEPELLPELDPAPLLEPVPLLLPAPLLLPELLPAPLLLPELLPELPPLELPPLELLLHATAPIVPAPTRSPEPRIKAS